MLLLYYCIVEITCPFLSNLGNGSLTYSDLHDQNSSYAFNVVATYSCNTGFSLVGNSNRTCTGDGNSTTGAFSGMDPTCEGESNSTIVLYIIIIVLITVFYLASLAFSANTIMIDPIGTINFNSSLSMHVGTNQRYILFSCRSATAKTHAQFYHLSTIYVL